MGAEFLAALRNARMASAWSVSYTHLDVYKRQLNNLRVLDYLRTPLGHDTAVISEWYRHWIACGFGALEAEAARACNDQLHLVGSHVTLADVCLVPQMYNARRFECDLQPYPRLKRISAHLEELPAFAKAAPEAQPDAV